MKQDKIYSNQNCPDAFYLSPEFQAFFQKSSRSMVIKCNVPHFTVLAVSDTHLSLTGKKRDEMLGRNLFDVFPGSQTDASEEAVVKNSFRKVMETRQDDFSPIQKYQISNPETGDITTEYWSSHNEPVLDAEGNVTCIVNTTANITNQLKDEGTRLEIRKHMEALEQARALNEKVQESNRQLHTAQDMLRELNEQLEQRVARRTKAIRESEARFRTTVEQAPIAIAICKGPQFIVELYNKRMLEFWQRTHEQVTDIPLFDAFPESRGQGYEEILTEVYQTGKPYKAEESSFTMYRKGILQTIWINLSYHPYHDENGDISGLIIVCNEITDQVMARQHLESIITEKTVLEKSLRHSQKHLQHILDAMAEGMLLMDAGGRFTYANEMAQRITGLSEEAFKRMSYGEPTWQMQSIDGTPLIRGQHPIKKMFVTGVPVYDFEAKINPPSGEPLYVLFNAAPLFDDDGALSGGIVTFMDVTARRKLMQQKDEFIGVASHELKTPLTALKTALQLVYEVPEEDKPTPLVATLVQEANRTANRLQMLINDLLDVNRIAAKQLYINKRTFNLLQVIKECCQNIHRVGTHEIKITGTVRDNVCADEQRICQVLINLLMNAVKYAPDSKQILINVSQTDHHIKVSITDFGIGIEAERLPYIFDRYYRATHTIGGVGQGGGLGLGLYISAEIIHEHDGEIGVESKPDEGSTFWFTLPVTETCN